MSLAYKLEVVHTLQLWACLTRLALLAFRRDYLGEKIMFFGCFIPKKNLVAGLLILIGWSPLIHSHGATEQKLFLGRQWAFLEHHFIVKPQEASASFISALKKNISSIFVAMLAGYGAYQGTRYLFPEKITRHQLPARALAIFICVPAAALWAGLAMHNYATYLIETNTECHSIESFVKNLTELDQSNVKVEVELYDQKTIYSPILTYNLTNC